LKEEDDDKVLKEKEKLGEWVVAAAVVARQR